MKTPSSSLLCLFMAASLAHPALAQEWTRFRGPYGTGTNATQAIPAKWTESDFNWKVALPGSGHSSPVVWGEKIFLLSGDEEAGGIMVLCLSTRDGRVLWRRDFPFPRWVHHRYNSFGSSSPAVDRERVYVCWTTPARYTLMAFDHEGNTVWDRDLGPFVSQHGGGTSPVVYEDKVILGNDQDGTSFLIAVEARTGETRWQTRRRSVAAAYGTPCVYQPEDGKPQLIFSSQAHGITAVDPANGKVLWEYEKAFDKRTVSSPMAGAGLIFGACGSGGGGNYVVAIRPPDSSSSQPSLAYEIRKSAPYVPTSVALGELIFLWSDSGIVTCLHAPTGQIRWQERVGGNFFGSPVCVGGRLFCVSASGEVVVLAASDKYQELGRNNLGELTRTTPAVSGGRLYIRTAQHLYSIGCP